MKNKHYRHSISFLHCDGCFNYQTEEGLWQNMSSSCLYQVEVRPMNHFLSWQDFWNLLFELSLLALKRPVRKHKGGNSRHGGWKVLVWY